MAIDFSLPTVSTVYTSVLTYIRDNITALSKMNFSGASNIPDGAIRWNSTDDKFEKYTLSTTTWSDLSSAYDMSVSTLTGNTATAAEITSVCDGNTATAAEIVKSSDGIGVTIPRQKIVEIGDWDMDSTLSKDVAHGLDVTKIIGVRVIIRDDSDTSHYPVGQNFAAITNMDAYWKYVGATNITLNRDPSGSYDTANFNSTSYNRGWIIFDYLD